MRVDDVVALMRAHLRDLHRLAKEHLLAGEVWS